MGSYGYRFTVPEMMGRISDNSLAQFELARQHQAVMLGSFNKRPLGSIKSECRCAYCGSRVGGMYSRCESCGAPA